MAYFGSLEVYLHIHSFRNIDLFHQGLYNVRAHIYREFPKQEFLAAVPSRITRNPLDSTNCKGQSGGFDKHCLVPPSIDGRAYKFTTRTFQIKYCDEEVELNEGCVFKVPLDLADPVTYTAPLFIELDLMFAESPSMGSRKGEELPTSLEDRAKIANYLVASSEIFAVESPVQGVAEYFQATFDALHCCVLHCTMVSAVVDIRNTPRDYPIRPSSEPRIHKRKPSPSLGYVSNTKSGKNAAKSTQENTSISNSSPLMSPKLNDLYSPIGSWNRDFPVKKSTGITFVEHIADAVKSLNLVLPLETDSASSYDSKIFMQRCDAVYHDYLLLLVRSYYRLRVHATMLSFRSLTEPEASTLEWLRSSRDLYLPGKISVRSQPNGLPEPMTISGDLKKLSFCIPAHLCADVAEAVFTGEQDSTSIAGSIRIVQVGYLPPSARAPKQTPSHRSAPHQVPLETVLQYIVTEDLNLVWRQVVELWHRILTLMTLGHKEMQFIHQLIWERRMVARCKEATFLEVMATRNPAMPVISHIGAVHASLSEGLRQRKSLQNPAALPIESVDSTFNILTCPILFEERISVVPAEVAGKRGYIEKRARLSSISGGYAETIPDDPVSRSMKFAKNRYIDRYGTPTEQDEKPGLVMSPRSALYNHQYEDFEALKTLAVMAAPAEGADAKSASPSTNADCDSGHDETLFAPEEILLDQEDFRYMKLNCPIFEESSSAPKLYRGSHLIVLVHGFQGNAMDMRTLRNQLSILFPEAIYLSSTSNEAHTESELGAMGRRLSEEILTYIKDLCPSDMIGRVSFIAHSLGGLIGRAALPHLGSLHDKFHTFLTLSSPHLGYIFARNRLVDAGLWFLRKWKKSASLQQLSMGDAKSHRDTLLYRMSLYPELKKFKNVVFVSCYQDQYVPYESARVEISEKIKNDPQWGQIHTEMARNIMNNINKESLVRLDVSFKIADK